MFPGINPKDLEKAMKKMGIKQEAVDATEVIIKTKDIEYVVRNPEVVKINMMGKDSFQVSGDIHEIEVKKYTEEDVKTVMEKADCTEKEAIKALENNDGDIAAAILELTQ
ncbi:MAG: nascent polypeptide-associated complex protein [Candidatus Nanoarchaeia archaeon]